MHLKQPRHLFCSLRSYDTEKGINSPLPPFGRQGGHVKKTPTLNLALSQSGGNSVIVFLFHFTQNLAGMFQESKVI